MNSSVTHMRKKHGSISDDHSSGADCKSNHFRCSFLSKNNLSLMCTLVPLLLLSAEITSWPLTRKDSVFFLSLVGISHYSVLCMCAMQISSWQL